MNLESQEYKVRRARACPHERASGVCIQKFKRQFRILGSYAVLKRRNSNLSSAELSETHARAPHTQLQESNGRECRLRSAGEISRYTSLQMLASNSTAHQRRLFIPRLSPRDFYARLLRASNRRRRPGRPISKITRGGRAVASGWADGNRVPLSLSRPFHVVAELPTLRPVSDVITLHLVHLMHPVASCGATGMSGRDSRVSAFDIPYCASAYQQVRPVDSPFVFILRTRSAIQGDREVTQPAKSSHRVYTRVCVCVKFGRLYNCTRDGRPGV